MVLLLCWDLNHLHWIFFVAEALDHWTTEPERKHAELYANKLVLRRKKCMRSSLIWSLLRTRQQDLFQIGVEVPSCDHEDGLAWRIPDDSSSNCHLRKTVERNSEK